MFDVVQRESVKKKKSCDFGKERKPFFSNSKFKKILIWFGVLLLIVILVGYFLYNNYYRNYNYIKEDRNQYLVYTLKTSTNRNNMHSEVPYINIDSEDARLVNQAIETYAETFLANKNNLMVYDSQLNGEVLSVLIRLSEYSEGYSFPEVSFHTYNFNLKSQTLMSNEELLSLFDVTEEEVKDKIEAQFEKYYQEEVDEGYLVAEECDYNCFLSWRGIENDDYLNSVYYYVKNGKLIAYRGFSTYSIYGEEEFFKDESYAFSISK